MDLNNIILIGLPGAGKTTLGKQFSEKLNMDFIDLDDYLVEKFDMSIEDMFKISETYFRDRESLVVEDMKNVKNCVIATGGGVVGRKENMDILKRCGKVIFIHKEVDNIIATVDMSGRPMLSCGKERLYKLSEERYPLYIKYSDYKIDNSGDLEEAMKKLLDVI